MPATRERKSVLEDAREGRLVMVPPLATHLNMSQSGLYGVIAREKWVESGKAVRIGGRVAVTPKGYAPLIGLGERGAA